MFYKVQSINDIYIHIYIYIYRERERERERTREKQKEWQHKDNPLASSSGECWIFGK